MSHMPCPFCGDDRTGLKRTYDRDGAIRVQIRCLGCDATVSAFSRDGAEDAKQRAWAKWDARA